MWILGASVAVVAHVLLEWLLNRLDLGALEVLVWAVFQGLLLPAMLIAFYRDLERQALKHAPQRFTEHGSVEVRDLSGRLLHTFAEGDLRAAQLSGIVLKRACLWGEHLEGADLRDADLRDAWLRAVVLQEADLRSAQLGGANLTDADLRNSDLRGADLTRVQLAGADIRGAVYDDTTRWPAGFRPDRRGCIRADGLQPDLPLPSRAADPGVETLPLPAEAEVETVEPRSRGW